MPFLTLTFGKRRRIPFTVKNPLGQVDTTTTATVGSTKPLEVAASINPTNNREVFVDGVGVSTSNASISISAHGKMATHDFAVPQPPDQSAVTLGTVSGEEDIPSP